MAPANETPSPKGRQFPDDLDGVLQHFRGRAQVIQLWRQGSPRERWRYLTRMRLEDYEPYALFLEIIQAVYGGGWYRARIYGEWDRQRRREEYLAQVTLGIGGAPTAETLALLQRPRHRRTRL